MQPIPPSAQRPQSQPAQSTVSRRRGRLGSALLIAAVIASGAGLAAWKSADLHAEEQKSQVHYEPTEVVTFGVATAREHVDTTTSIGTVRALRSVVLQNELAGTVRDVQLVSGQVVEQGTLL